MKTVLQVGDIADVATGLCDALRRHSDWEPIRVEVAGLRRTDRLSRLADLPLRAAKTRRLVRRAVKEHRPAVVHLHWARYAPFIDTRGVPLVVHAHGSDIRQRTSGPGGYAVNRALSKAGAVLVSTPDLLIDVPAGSRYLPNPVDVDMFDTGDFDDSSHRTIDHTPTVLLFARLLPIKGADRLVEIASVIRSLDRGARVLALGGGELDHAAAAAGVEILPTRPRGELPALLHSVDVVVGQQRLGILSLSELEAMACGRPVVMPLRRDLYEHDIPTVEESDPAMIAARCLELASDAGARRVAGAAGREYVVRHHSPQVVAAQLVDVYEDLGDPCVSRSRRASP